MCGDSQHNRTLTGQIRAPAGHFDLLLKPALISGVELGFFLIYPPGWLWYIRHIHVSQFPLATPIAITTLQNLCGFTRQGWCMARKILVVEDHQKMRELLVRLLSGEGYEVTGAVDGR